MNYWLNLSSIDKVAKSIVNKFGMDIFSSTTVFFDKLDDWLEKNYPNFLSVDFSIHLEIDGNTGEVALISVVPDQKSP